MAPSLQGDSGEGYRQPSEGAGGRGLNHCRVPACLCSLLAPFYLQIMLVSPGFCICNVGASHPYSWGSEGGLREITLTAP